jgi:putative Mn2+ efflux pump MntP
MIIEMLLLSIGLAMDAFAVSLSKGAQSDKKLDLKLVFTCGIVFGLFQFIMPLLGYFFASFFIDWIREIDHWIAFVILAVLGIKMIFESLSKKEETMAVVSFKTILILGIATSIDALSAGITLLIYDTNSMWLIVSTIGIVTFVLSSLGVILGYYFKNKVSNKFEIIGGIILISLGVKILIEHLFF